MTTRPLSTAAIISVGDGRGFLVKHRHEMLVITAAHCLPSIPAPHPARHLEESTFQLLSALGEQPTIWAECLFVDVIADLAVLGPPDGQELYDEHEAYLAFTGARRVLRLGDLPQSALGLGPIATHPIRVLRLDGEWARGQGSHFGGSISLHETSIASGMSGSPILDRDDWAVGVVSTGRINPRLARDLPAWLAPKASRPPKVVP